MTEAVAQRCSVEVADRPATLLKKRLWHRCFPVNFAKFLRIPFLQNTSGGCFLNENKALARPFISGLSEALTKTLRLKFSILTLIEKRNKNSTFHHYRFHNTIL